MTRIMGTLIGIEEGMIEEGITIEIMMSLTGVELATEEGIHHLIHLIHPIQMPMTSMDADAPTRIAIIDIETTIKTDP